MSSNDVCEIKSIRTDIVDDIAHKMKDDDIVLKTCNLFKILFNKFCIFKKRFYKKYGPAGI